MPKISIIMPVYNTKEEYLKESIESVLSQTCSDLELIIVDDGSTNNAKEVIFSYNDERIKYIYQENKGLGGARNKGIGNSTGEYILFLDSDDLIDKEACEKVYQKAKKNDLDVLFFGMNLFKDKTKRAQELETFFPPHEKFDAVFNLRHPQIMSSLFSMNSTACAKIFKRNLFSENKLEFVEGIIFEDTEFFVRFMLKAQRIGFSKEPYYFYRMNVIGSLTAKKDQNHFDLIRVFKLIENTLVQNKLLESLHVQFYNYVLKTLYSRYKNIDKNIKKQFKQNIANYLSESGILNLKINELSLQSKLIYDYFVMPQRWYNFYFVIVLQLITKRLKRKNIKRKKIIRVSYSWVGDNKKHEFETSEVKVTTKKIKKCDLYIALNGPRDKIDIEAKQAWVFTAEPPDPKSSGLFKDNFGYYDRAYTSYPSMGNDNIINNTVLTEWWIGKTYSELLDLQVTKKNDDVVWVTSNLAWLEGHKRRLKFIDYIQKNTDYKIYGRGINPIISKYDVYKNAKYVIGVENTYADDYWTEKIADSYLAYCMPIYYGCPNITKYFPKESMIIIDMEKPEEAKQIIQNAIDEDLYTKNFKYILEAREIVLKKLWVYPFVISEMAKLDFDSLKYKKVKIPACYKYILFNTLKRKLKNRLKKTFKLKAKN